MIAAELSVVGGKHGGQVIPLNRKKFLIGREQDCQLRPNSEMVSRHHCVFSLDDFSVRLRDLGSTNGTFVNGTRVMKETVLNSGDHVVIGNLEFQLKVIAGKLVESGSSADIDLRRKPEDTQVSSQTAIDLPIAQPTPSPADASADTVITTAAALTTALAVQSLAPESFAAASVAAPVGSTVAAPVPSAAFSPDATMVAPPMMQPQYGFSPQMMQPMGFPGGMYGGYPYQHMMPGYGQMYPQFMSPPMGGYQMPMQQPVTAPAAAVPAAPGGVDANVQLPDPESTGARTEAAKGSTGSDRKDTQKPTGAAAAILNQMNSRR